MFLPVVLGGSVRASAWTPLALSPALWLKADGGLYTDAARTTPVSADSDPIGGETDYSVNANHPTQSTSARQNLYRTGRQNSLPAVVGDGTRGVSALGTPVVLSGDFSVFFAGMAALSGAQDCCLMGKVGASKYFGDFFQGKIYFVPDSGAGVETSTTAYTASAWSFLEFRRTGSTFKVFRDRIQIGTDLSTSGTFTVDQIGGLNGANSPWKGDRGELVICTADVGTTAAIQAWRSIGSKWALYPTQTTRTLIGQGDSNMVGVGGAASAFDSMTTAQTTTRTNVGIIGQWVSAGGSGGGMLANEKTAVFPYIAPNAPWSGMVIMGGTNDLATGGTDAATAFAALQSCVNDFLAACTAKGVTGKVLVRPIPNFTPTYGDPDGQAALNALIKAAYVDATVPNVYSYAASSVAAVTAAGASANATYFQGDGLHLTTAGQNVYAAADAAVIDSWG